MSYLLYSIDNWAFYQSYLSAALKFQQPTECLDFLNNIINTSEKSIRAPYLARLDLLKRAHISEDLECSLQPVDFMREYFAQFGEKGCVVGDLRLYLNLLTPKMKIELFEKVRRSNLRFLKLISDKRHINFNIFIYAKYYKY